MQLYNITPGEYLKYYTLVTSIPHEWTLQLRSEPISYTAPNNLITKIKEQTKVCKLIYTILTKKSKPEIIKQAKKWENNLSLVDINWKKIFTQPIRITIETKLREFQYKYLMHIIPNNNFLFKCNIVASQLCDFCTMHNDSNFHMFWECHLIQDFWIKITDFLRTILRTNNLAQLNYEYISLCNFNHNNIVYEMNINYIILLAKYFIFKCKCEKNIPTGVQFVAYFKHKIKIEETIALFKNKQNTFNVKWRPFLNLIN